MPKFVAMDVSNSLKQLLYQHDCVIVPDFGGFVCAHKKLEFNIHTGLIHPARKTVAFNQNLNNNDGLLANYIVQKEKVGNAQALENINAWVSSLHHQLQQGQTVNIYGLGSFSLNPDKKVIFIPFADVNFSTATYGLASLQLNKKIGGTPIKEDPKVIATPPPPIPIVNPQIVEPEKAEDIETEEEKEAIVADIRPTIPPKPKKKKRRTLRRILGIAFMLLLFFAFFIYQDYAYHSIMDKGGLMDFGKSSKTDTDNNGDKTERIEYIEIEGDDSDEATDNSDASEDETSNSLENSTVTQDDVETSIVETAKTDSVFYIIAGAFNSERNANDLLEDLNRKGFAPEIIKTPSSSFYRVGYRQYPSRKKAEGNLNLVRNKTHNYAAWVLAVKP